MDRNFFRENGRMKQPLEPRPPTYSDNRSRKPKRISPIESTLNQSEMSEEDSFCEYEFKPKPPPKIDQNERAPRRTHHVVNDYIHLSPRRMLDEAATKIQRKWKDYKNKKSFIEEVSSFFEPNEIKSAISQMNQSSEQVEQMKQVKRENQSTPKKPIKVNPQLYSALISMGQALENLTERLSIDPDKMDEKKELTVKYATKEEHSAAQTLQSFSRIYLAKKKLKAMAMARERNIELLAKEERRLEDAANTIKRNARIFLRKLKKRREEEAQKFLEQQQQQQQQKKTKKK